MRALRVFLFCCCLLNVYATPVAAARTVALASAQQEAQAAFRYFLDEVDLDPTLTHEDQQNRIQVYKEMAAKLSPEAAATVTDLLIKETFSRIVDILVDAKIDDDEVDAFLADYRQAIHDVQNMTVEIAREMLFFVAELKIHRQLVYDFGIALGCPEKQLRRHDLCKLDVEQFEGYARYFRGGRQDEDKIGYLAAWDLHQHEEHHHQCYSKEGFSFDSFTDERLRDNMLETTADLLAATKQRGGGTLVNYLLNIFPKQNPHPRLIPFLEAGLKQAHALYLDAEENPNSPHKLFRGLPCWSNDVEAVFNQLKQPRQEEMTSTKAYAVGELGTSWQFPSDHLPVGATVGSLYFALWNTLNSDYLHWIEKNAQGLKDSLILQANVPSSDNAGLTVREEMIIDDILQMLNHATHPRSVLVLQEVGAQVSRELSRRLPETMQIIPVNNTHEFEDIFIVDTRVVDVLGSEIFHYSFDRNPIIRLVLREKRSGLKYCFIQSHVPGGPTKSLPARVEFTAKVMQTYDPEEITILLGDMNCSPDAFLAHFAQEAKNRGLATQPFQIMEVPYPTHIDTQKSAVWIDNIFIANPNTYLESHVTQDGQELCLDLQPMLDLLRHLQKTR